MLKCKVCECYQVGSNNEKELIYEIPMDICGELGHVGVTVYALVKDSGEVHALVSEDCLKRIELIDNVSRIPYFKVMRQLEDTIRNNIVKMLINKNMN